MPDPTQYELSDVDVDTLGLVTRGANREEFFMLKSADANPEPASDVISESVWRKIATVIKNAFSLEADDSVTEPITPAETSKDAEPTEPAPEVEKLVESPPVEPSEPAAEPAAEPESLQKESTAMSEETQVVAEYVSKSEHDEIVRELGVLKAALAKAEEDKERAVYLTKAQSYTAIPVSQSELADYMYWLAKTDEARYTWFESVIKAIDNTMQDANLFVEKGTATPVQNDAITAALKSADPRAALLSLDRNAASAYLQSVRRAAAQ